MSKFDADRILEMGHRNFVGGDGANWDQIGQLQFNFLKSEGLRPQHTLADIACGSLRAGRLFIDYLNPGHYLGVDKEINLIIHGIAQELGIPTFNEKKPEFVVSDTFELSKFSKPVDYAIAQSLLTHLTVEDIYQCLKAVRRIINMTGSFYVTFFEVDTPVNNYVKSDAIDCFYYTQNEMNMLSNMAGWNMQYIGNWNHPRNQKMVKLLPK